MNEIERRRRHPNWRSGLLENLKLLENLSKNHRTSLPLTADHRGRRRWGGERPDLEGKGTLKEEVSCSGKPPLCLFWPDVQRPLVDNDKVSEFGKRLYHSTAAFLFYALLQRYFSSFFCSGNIKPVYL
jgi:hypothetical protein